RRRHLAVRRIRNHPRTAVLRVVVLVPVRRPGARVVVGGAADRGGNALGLLMTTVEQLRELSGRDLIEPLTGKLRLTLHRDAAFVAVAIRAGDIGIAPSRS